MFTAILDLAPNRPASRQELERQENLVAATEELAGLQLSILIAAKCAASGSLAAGDRAHLRAERAHLRTLFSVKIDQIAMTFGVQEAMDAQAEVERNVTIPKPTKPPARPAQYQRHYF
jgi:hypothetical protein